MSQTKAQLIQPIGVVTTSGVVVTGVMTASSFDGVVTGSASSVTQGKNLNLGAVNAVSFAGDFTGNATGIITSSAIKVGSLTASSFVGDFTGTATSMAKGTGFKAGTVTATPANVTYTVTVGSKTGGGNAYYLDGTEAPTPSLYPGATYTFDQAAGTNATHPLRFATAADAAGSTEYTFQVTTNGTPGSAGAYTRIVVSPSAPDTLYYYCTNHSGMGDSINITNLLQGPVTGAVTGDVKGNIDGDLTGNLTGDVTGNVTGNVTGVSTGNVTGNVTGNLVGVAGSVLQGTNIHVGVMTAVTLIGDGSNLTGIAATNYNTQTVTANSGTTAIDLSAGNMITFNQSSNTTVSFANTSEAMSVTLIRDKDNNNTERTITWPSSIQWDGGSAPTLLTTNQSGHIQQFEFLTRDSGVTWYAWENMKYNPAFSFKKMSLFAWGTNDKGELGQNNRTERSSPIQIPGEWTSAATFAQSGSGAHGQVRLATKDSKLWAWGSNQNYSLGLSASTNAHKSSPTQVGTESIWTGAKVYNQRQSFALNLKGELYGWGYNYNGSVGNNAGSGHAGSVTTPVQIGTDTTWRSLASSQSWTAGIKSDGTLWSWGYNVYGSLGHNNRTSRSSPMQIGTGTDWKQVTSGSYAGAALKTNGTLYSWGKDANGSLGLNESGTLHYSSPTQIPGTTWDKISLSNTQTMGIKTNGSLWAWGSGYYGNLGDGESGPGSNHSSPIQVGTNTNWSQVASGAASASCGIKNDGTVWTWGTNESGMLGHDEGGNPGMRSSPTQIPGMSAPSSSSIFVGAAGMIIGIAED